MSLLRLFAGPILCLFTFSVHAGDVLFYVSENGEPANTEFAFSINGDQKAINKSGVAFFDLPAGSYDVQFLEFGEDAGSTSFTLAEGNNAEIIIELIDGVPETQVSVYTPGAEESPPVGLILGEVSTLEDSAPQGLEGANVSVSGSNVLIVTDEFGGYAVQLARGVYELTVDHPDHGSRTISDVYVISGVTSQLNLTFSPEGADDPLLEEVVTVGQYQPNDIAQTERFSVTVIDALSAEQIARFGDADAAASLQRVSGVTTDRGQFAIVRGLSGRYVSSTLNGIVTPSTDPLRRDAPLDLFPSGVLESISVNKGFTPASRGDSTGGFIDIRTRGIPDERTSKFSASLGVNTQVTFDDVQTYDGGNRDFFGVDDGTRDLPGAVSAIFGSDGTQNTGLAANSLDPALVEAAGESFENTFAVQRETARPEISLGYNNGNRYERDGWAWGYYVDLDFSSKTNTQEDGFAATILPGNEALFSAQAFERSTVETGFSYYFVGGLEYDNGTELLAKTLISRETEDTVRETLTPVTDDNEFTEFDTLLQFVERQLITQQFEGTHFPFGDDASKLEWRASFSNTSREEPDRREFTLFSQDPDDFAQNGVDALTIFTNSIERSFGDLDEDAINLGLDFEFPIETKNGLITTLKTGADWLSRDRESTFARFNFIDTPANPIINGSNDVESVLTPDNIGPGAITLQNLTTPSDVSTGDWTIASIYFQGESELTEEISLLYGARVEDSDQEVVTADPNSDNFDDPPIVTGVDERETLPALALTWSPDDKNQVKFGFGQTVSRPEFTELTTTIFLDPTFNFPVQGNPELQTSTIDNFDIRYEHYFNDEDSVSVALFYKDIENPIEQVVDPGSAALQNLRTYRNVPSAEVYGLEVDVQKTFFENDRYSWFVFGNLSLIESAVSLDGDSALREGRAEVVNGQIIQIGDDRRLQGQSDWILNAVVGFNDFKYNQEATLLFNVSGDRISEVGSGAQEDILLEPFLQLDFNYKIAVNERLDFKFKATNILNDSVERTQSGRTATEFDVGTTLQFGIDYKL